MQEIINCPSCQRKLQVPEALLGQDVQCPTCGATFTATAGNSSLPRPSAAPPPPPPPAPYDSGGLPSERPERRRDRYDDDDDYNDVERPRRPRRDLLPHRGTTILVLGILSLVLCPLILGPIAWIMGNQDLSEIRAGRMDPEGEGTTQAGRICGMIGTFFAIAVIGFYCLIFMAMFAGGAGRGRF